MAPKFDVYTHVTDTIIAEIEAGTPPWRKPWTGSTSGIALPKRYNGAAYRGINILMLWVMAAKNGYVSSRWMTYRQAKELGGQVRGGETSATVVKYGTFRRENEQGIDEELPYARAYRVFNADQIEGLAEDYYTRPELARDLGTEADPGAGRVLCPDRSRDRHQRRPARLLQPRERSYPYAADCHFPQCGRLLWHIGP